MDIARAFTLGTIYEAYKHISPMSKLLLTPCSAKETITFANVEHPNPFQCEITVSDSHTSNEVNHINNIQYIRWIDKAAEMHCDASDWTRERMLQDGIMWFVARHEIDYVAEATSSDQLRLTTWVDDVRRVKSWRTTVIHTIGDPHKEVCRCKTLWVLVNLETRRPISVPLEMAQAIEPLHKPRVTAP
jgi:acyl-CoA thioester hydrolase